MISHSQPSTAWTGMALAVGQLVLFLAGWGGTRPPNPLVPMPMTHTPHTHTPHTPPHTHHTHHT